MTDKQTPIIIAITGASGAIYGVRLLEALQHMNIPTELIISKAGRITIKHELDMSVSQVEALATTVHNIENIGACISSGSYKSKSMIIAPCSMKTLAEIASGLTPNLVSRSADVILKERRKLILITRESPLHLGHIENMSKVTQMGGIIAPPVPAFYTKPSSIDDIVNHTVGRTLDLCDIDSDMVNRWNGLQ